MALSSFNISLMVLPLNGNMGCTLAQLTSLKTAEFDVAAAKFKACQKASLDTVRDIIDRGDAAWMLTERLHKGGWYGPGC